MASSLGYQALGGVEILGWAFGLREVLVSSVGTGVYDVFEHTSFIPGSSADNLITEK